MLLCMASYQQTRPGIGELAKDSGKGRIGFVMDGIGGRVQMRPIHGGVEWDAMPEQLVALSTREELSVRRTMKNSNSRVGL